MNSRWVRWEIDKHNELDPEGDRLVPIKFEALTLPPDLDELLWVDFTDPAQDAENATLLARPWVTIVWNDPVNLMSYVTFVFQKYFGYSKSKATKLMMEVHVDGRSVVSTGSREEMERDVQAMHEYGLWATMQKADA